MNAYEGASPGTTARGRPPDRPDRDKNQASWKARESLKAVVGNFRLTAASPTTTMSSSSPATWSRPQRRGIQDQSGVRAIAQRTEGPRAPPARGSPRPSGSRHDHDPYRRPQPRRSPRPESIRSKPMTPPRRSRPPGRPTTSALPRDAPTRFCSANPAQALPARTREIGRRPLPPIAIRDNPPPKKPEPPEELTPPHGPSHRN